MISLLVPSRGRPDSLCRLLNSIERTTWGEWEIVVRLDTDDPRAGEYPLGPRLRQLRGPRTVLSRCWNECAEAASGDVLWHGGDDVVFRTLGWDEIVCGGFPADGIAFVHGHDLSPNGHWLGTHGFLTREWVEIVGRFVPPHFASDYNDLWLVEVADAIDRHVYVPIVTEHMHPDFGKGPRDQTHLERIERHVAGDMDSLYRTPELVAERRAEADRLKAAIR